MGDLQNELTIRSEERLRDIQEICKLLRHEVVQREVGKVVDLEKVELVLVALDDETLHELAIQSNQLNDQIEAGITMWGWIGIAILAAIAIIILGIIYGRDA